MLMMKRLLTPDQRVAQILSAHHSVVSGAEARSAGLTQRQIDLRVETGRWSRPVRGVFVLVGSPDTWQQRAMVASLATRDAGGVLSSVTAGAAFGVLAASPLPHVS